MSKASETPGLPVRAEPARKKKKSVKITKAQREAGGEGPEISRNWRNNFLWALIDTSNVKKSAKEAGISTSRVYKVRKEEPDFAVKWREALFEGYENLEMEVLGYLRDPCPEHKMDVANAIRMLARHRELIVQQRALEDNRDEQEVLDSIDKMIDGMRQRAAENAALLAKVEPGANKDDDFDAD